MSAAGINTHIITKNAVTALRSIGDNGPSTRGELVASTGMSSESAHNALRSLRFRKMAGSDRDGRTYTWHLTPRGCRALNRMEGS